MGSAYNPDGKSGAHALVSHASTRLAGAFPRGRAMDGDETGETDGSHMNRICTAFFFTSFHRPYSEQKATRPRCRI